MIVREDPRDSAWIGGKVLALLREHIADAERDGDTAQVSVLLRVSLRVAQMLDGIDEERHRQDAARLLPRPPEDAPTVFELYRTQTSGALSKERARSLTLRTREDFLRNALVLDLLRESVAERVLTDDVPVTVTGSVHVDQGDIRRSVMFELPRTWWQRLLRRPARHVWLPAVGQAVVHGAPREVEVTGRATVPVSALRVFPDADPALYPQSFGMYVRRHHVGEGYPSAVWEARPDGPAAQEGTGA